MVILSQKIFRRKIILTLTGVLLLTTAIKSNANDFELDVISYQLTIEPSIDERHISSTVIIRFVIDKNATSVILKSGNLTIDKVTGDNVIGFENSDGNLVIKLSEREKEENELAIDYHGNPTRGLLFDPSQGQAFTVYSTSQWMVCNDIPGDKALFHLNISVPVDKSCIASGELISQIRKNGKAQYSYQQNYESPPYTYGFAIGSFNQVEEQRDKMLLRYYSQNYSSDQLTTIFQETPSMMSFLKKNLELSIVNPRIPKY
ncbi:MAG: hypothetical protein AAF705_11575 [Bacteroidota bacterium]